MANRLSRIVIPMYAPSYDGRYHGRYPHGDKPFVGADLNANAIALALAQGQFNTAIRLGASPTVIASAQAGLSTGVRLGANALAVATASVQGIPLYYGRAIDVFASPNGTGTQSGSSEANSAPLSAVMATSGMSAGTKVGMVPGLGAYVGAPDHSSAGRWHPIFGPVSGGAPGNPIEYICKFPAAYYRSTPQLWCEFRSSDPHPPVARSEWRNSPVLGVTHGISDVSFIGAFVDQQYAPPRPSNGMFLISHSCFRVLFEGFYVIQTVNPGGDNYDSGYMEGCSQATFRNGVVEGGNSGGFSNHNAAAITPYGSLDITLEHLEFYNVNQAVFIKGTLPDVGTRNSGRLRYCKLVTCAHTFVDLSVIDQDAGFDVYQNVMIDTGRAIVVDNASAIEGGPCRVYNNTIINPRSHAWEAEVSTQLAGHTFQRNIVYRGANSAEYAMLFSGPTAADMSTIDDNLYQVVGGNPRWRQNDTNYNSLQDWRDATGKEAASAVGDPGFLNVAGGNFKRSSYADGRGAYITGNEEIGLQANPVGA